MWSGEALGPSAKEITAQFALQAMACLLILAELRVVYFRVARLVEETCAKWFRVLGTPRISRAVWEAPDWLGSVVTRAEKGHALVLSIFLQRIGLCCSRILKTIAMQAPWIQFVLPFRSRFPQLIT